MHNHNPSRPRQTHAPAADSLRRNDANDYPGESMADTLV
jgi:hypothetical protein